MKSDDKSSCEFIVNGTNAPPLSKASTNLVVFSIAFTENRTGICVPERCDETESCPSIGNGCREYPYGLVTGVCENHFCNYSSTPQVMFKCLDPNLVVRGNLNFFL